MKKFEINSKENGIFKKTIIEAKNFEELKSNTQLPKNIIKIKQKNKFSINTKQTIKYNSLKELSFVGELDMLLGVKIPFFESVSILSKNGPNHEIREISKNLSEHISTGKNFESFFENEKTFLSQLSILFFKLSDVSGNINGNINSLHQILKEQFEQKSKIKDALTYPIFLFFVMIFAISIILGFVVPQFQNMIQTSNELPVLTEFIFWASNHYQIIISFILIPIILIIFGINIKKISKNEKFNYKIDEFLVCKIPIVSNFIFVYNMQIWLSVLKGQINAKYKLHDAINFSQIAISNTKLKEEIKKLLTGLGFGNSLSQTMKNSNFFDNITINLIEVAEETNNYEAVFEQLHSIYKSKLNTKIRLFTLLFEPIFAITIATILLIVALGIFIPIWDFANFTKF